MAHRTRFLVARIAQNVFQAFIAAVGRLDKSLSPSVSIQRLRNHTFTLSDTIWIFHFCLATFWLTLMPPAALPLKLGIPFLYTLAILIPFTSQFFLPATPVLAWVLTLFTSRFIPAEYRPSISVSLLPTLESVLYGANISDILTRFTHPVLDIMAWLPYGVIHFTFPFVVAAFLWLFRPKEALHLWARAFGYMNLIGVFTQIIFPCAAPWYELIHGLTPADYSMKGSPGGLARIDALFNSNGYTTTFSNAPVVFGAFPSLHAGCATIEALFVSHFFPPMTRYIWVYTGILYWATMYLTHHYLIDVVSGACLATACFYLYLPDDLRGPAATSPPGGPGNHHSRTQRSKYEIYDLEAPRRANNRSISDASDFDLSDVSSRASEEEEMDITFRSPVQGDTPTSSMPFMPPSRTGHRETAFAQAKKNHRHTASIASLIRADERAEDGWSPITGNGFNLPPAPTRMGRDGEGSLPDVRR